MNTKIIKVKTKSKNYEVHIGTNIISKLRNIIKKNKLSFSKCLIVIDSKIPKKFRTILLRNLNDQKIFTLNFNANEKNKSNLRIMNRGDIINFMQTYQRITQNMFRNMPKYASVIFNLNSNHQIKSAVYKKK